MQFSVGKARGLDESRRKRLEEIFIRWISRRINSKEITFLLAARFPKTNKCVCDTQANPDITLVHISCFEPSSTWNFFLQIRCSLRQQPDNRGIRKSKAEKKETRRKIQVFNFPCIHRKMEKLYSMHILHDIFEMYSKYTISSFFFLNY